MLLNGNAEARFPDPLLDWMEVNNLLFLLDDFSCAIQNRLGHRDAHRFG
jgi:hypothetical protein